MGGQVWEFALPDPGRQITDAQFISAVSEILARHGLRLPETVTIYREGGGNAEAACTTASTGPAPEGRPAWCHQAWPVPERLSDDSQATAQAATH